MYIVHTGEKLHNTQAESSNWMAKIINYRYNYDVTGDIFLHWSNCTKKMLRQNFNIKKITLTSICRSNGEIQVLQEVWERARQLGLSYMIIFTLQDWWTYMPCAVPYGMSYWAAKVLPGWAYTSSLIQRPSMKCCNKLINTYTKENLFMRQSLIWLKKMFFFATISITLN